MLKIGKSAPRLARLNRDSRVDQTSSVTFTFDGTTYTGYTGDTLASALLANDVHLVGRSFKYHRPRGILSSGSEEPNALIRLGRGAYAEPNLRATQIEIFDGLYAESQNRVPSLVFDIGAINSILARFFPAGFYYKTFMWPATMWMKYEHVIRHAAGLGKAADAVAEGARHVQLEHAAGLLLLRRLLLLLLHRRGADAAHASEPVASAAGRLRR